MHIFFIFSKHPVHNQSSITNPQYFDSQTGCPIYEEYSTIDDVFVSKNILCKYLTKHAPKIMTQVIYAVICSKSYKL